MTYVIPVNLFGKLIELKLDCFMNNQYCPGGMHSNPDKSGHDYAVDFSSRKHEGSKTRKK